MKNLTNIGWASAVRRSLLTPPLHRREEQSKNKLQRRDQETVKPSLLSLNKSRGAAAETLRRCCVAVPDFLDSRAIDSHLVRKDKWRSHRWRYPRIIPLLLPSAC